MDSVSGQLSMRRFTGAAAANDFFRGTQRALYLGFSCPVSSEGGKACVKTNQVAV